MFRKIKALLIVLLVMVVPVQGLAAVSAGICRALEHHGDTAARAAVQEARAGHSSDGVSHENDAAGTDNDSSDLNRNCGGCAACGTAATIASTAFLSTPDAPRSAARVHEPDSPAGFLPDGLDRPPLTLPV